MVGLASARPTLRPLCRGAGAEPPAAEGVAGGQVDDDQQRVEDPGHGRGNDWVREAGNQSMQA